MFVIAGYIGSRTIDRNVIHRMLHMMQSRGPDNKAYIEKKIKKKVILLHSRLSIIDLEKRSINHSPKIILPLHLMVRFTII